jgi:uncharacterized membrane protein
MEQKDFAFGNCNYIIIGISVIIIIIGFMLMSGSGVPEDGVSFNPEIFSKQRIVVAPLITVLGFALTIVGILYNKKDNKSKG